MNNPITQSAYTLEQVADWLSVDVVTLKKKLAQCPESFPPFTRVGRASKQDGALVFPARLFNEWLEQNAEHAKISSSEADKFLQH